MASRATSRRLLPVLAAAPLALLTACGAPGGSAAEAIGPEAPEDLPELLAAAAETAPAPFTADEGFTVEFPLEPDRSEQLLPVDGGEVPLVLYEAQTSREFFGVAVTDFGVEPANPLPEVLTSSVDGAARTAGGTVTSRTELTFLGLPAQEATISGDGIELRMLTFVHGTRHFQIQSATAAGDAHPAFDRAVWTFQLT